MAYAAADEVFVPLLRNAAAPHQSPSVTAFPRRRRQTPLSATSPLTGESPQGEAFKLILKTRK